MDSRRLEPIERAISYIETHLEKRLSLDDVAQRARYSKYHLHRMFTDVVGVTPHSYIQRRQLTEAARRLVYSDRPILEIALTAGYESQQAFAAIFKAMYKHTPREYRRNGRFYPLQLRHVPLAPPRGGYGLKILRAEPSDIPDWMRFAALVVGGFPCLEEGAHLEQVKRYVRERQALIMRDTAAVVGAAAFSVRTGSIDFLAVHPQYRRLGAAQTLLEELRRQLFAGRTVTITTFREGDRADPGQRAEYKRLGFAEAELLTEFGYPTQRLILRPGREENSRG